MVLCSQEFRIAISSAIKSIPEGQATGCIRQLATDISESLDWMKGNCSIAAEKGQIDLQAELLGRGLSEVYTLILDSLTVTTGNSSSVGVSLKGLVAVIRPIMSGLVGLQEDPLYEFMSIFMGSTFSKKAGKRTEVYSQWAVLLFFRLYLSSRSLQRQIISLVPPDTSRELSGVMHDSFTAYSARDWLESAGGGDESYFSWIVQPSTSLLSVLQAVSNIFIADTFASCSPLVYVLNAMALQRLVDLNKLIKSFEYLLQRNDNLILSKLTDDTGSSLRRKRSRKWRRCVSDLRQEAEGLTEFIMGYLPLVAKDHLCISSTVGARQWDFGISSMNEKSLPSAIWWIICQNVDIWSRYAANKKLKKFLSLLIQNSLPNTISSTNRPDSEKTVSVHQISVDLLSDAVLYEQRFARRHMASRFCRLLEKTVSATSGNAGKVDLSSPPNWSEVLNALTNRSITVSDNNDVLHDGSCGTEQITNSFKKIDMKPCMEQKFFPSVIVEFTSCQNLLNFLSWMPKGYLTSQSITIYITCILNLERSVVGSLLDCQGAICSPDHRELFRLLMSCRRALKNLLMAVSEERMEARKSSHASTVFRSSFSVLWLLKSLSAVIELQHACTEDGPTSQVKDMTFSLIDHTSYVFLTLSRDRFLHAIRFLKYTGEKPNVPVFHKKGDLTKVDPCSISSEDSIDAWEGVFQLAETLREQTQKLLIPLEEVQVSDGIHGCKKLSSVISCFQGFLWGLSSALSQLDAEIRDLEIKSFTCKFEPVCKVNLCIDTFAKFVSNFLCGLFLDDFTLPQSLSEAQALPLLESTGNFVGVKDSSPEGPPDVRDNSSKRVRRKRFRSDNAFPDDIFAKVELFDQQCIKMALLRSFLGGENLEAAVFLRQLFIASSAILRLNLHFNSTSFSSGLVPIFIGISECLLLAFVDKVEVPQPFSFVWMDGIVMFLEELGNHFALMNPNLSRNLYVKMVDLHLTAIGKCIALQGKGATLASHETDSSTMTLGGEMKLSESTLSHGVYCLNEFKARLRRSCTVYIKKPSELHLLSAVQAIERALVGVSDGCTMNYDICTGGSDGGKVSKIVAAGIDCLDLVLEFVEGRKRLSVVGRHIQSLVACLFNIILHLQGPKIFFHNVSLSRGDADPDPGSITLMCVEVLTRVCGKHAFFQWDACYVAESLRMPAALFQNFLELGISDAATKSNSLKFSEIFDRQFSMDLYAACCRLLYTVLKHHKRYISSLLLLSNQRHALSRQKIYYTNLRVICRESQQCIALLEDSVSVLLHCLETVDIDQAVGKGHPTWQVQGGVKCACSLRRIYEEIRQQKDALGQHSFQFLSSYIWIYSGYGPLRSGIRREIDEALRPGVYALIDACSPDDLQHIHTVFGEGPCRSTLAALQHDYKQNFQYEGKV
ncbi:hypothetical protein RJ639_037824 [Escallonia herrerae]|uniref:Nucleolar 27S pre-rRNA processing Urb2/Npa2 C-terminal domain-containing protein n=1 Tax=Escallonia herrerae TaxID=1293975 RepID=A0AA88WKS0_9ASTE|nr:hypothetical protein RJ639_037824 [Escallonia herrerae]